MKIKHLILNSLDDEKTIQDWLDENPSIQILCVTSDNTEFYIFYEESV